MQSSSAPRDGEACSPRYLLDGSESAARELDRHFRDRLCALVEREMNARFRRREDPEDVVQSVFRTFFRRASMGQYGFHHQGALWKLLQQIARRKILKHVERQQAQRRDVNREESVAGCDPPESPPERAMAGLLGDALEYVLKGLEAPEPQIFRLQLHGYTVAEVIDVVLRGLESPYPEILQLRLQGLAESQIAAELECGREAVRYRLKRICERLSGLLNKDSEISP